MMCTLAFYLYIYEYKLSMHLILLLVYGMFDMHAYLINCVYDRISYTLLYLNVYVWICI